MMSGGAHHHGEETTILTRHLHPLFVPPPPRTGSGEYIPSSLSPSRPPTPPPPRRRRRATHGVPPTPVLPFEAQSVVLVRDPPKDRLARSKESLAEDEEPPLARVAGKHESGFRHYPSSGLDLHPTTTTTAKRSSLTASEDFFADLYEYYYDDAAEDFIFPTPKPPKPLTLSTIPIDHAHSNPKLNPNPIPSSNLSNHPPKRVTKSKSVKDTISNTTNSTMAKKRRGSLQAIFVPSFLQSSGTLLSTTSVPSSPTSAKYASNGQGRSRGLSGAAPSAPPTPSGASHTLSSGSSSPSPLAQDFSIPPMPTSRPGSPTTLVNALPPIVPLTPEIIPMPEQHQRKRSVTFSMSRVSSPRSSPPPDFLLDDDPFANLTGPPIDRVGVLPPPPVPPLPSGNRPAAGLGQSQAPLPLTPVDAAPAGLTSPVSPPPMPRSPLHEFPQPKLASLDAAALASVSGSSSASASSSSTTTTTSASGTVISASTSTSTSPVISASASASTTTTHSRPPHPHLAPLAPSKPITPGLATAPSSPPAGRGLPGLPPRTRPAYQRPAFSSRPSLPSLDTLARMNIVLTKKVRKGRVGAGLPFEPWDLPSDEELPSAPGTRPQTPTRVHSASPSLSSILSSGALPTTAGSSTTNTSVPLTTSASSSEAGNGAFSRPISPPISTTPTPSVPLPAPLSPVAQVAKPQPLLPSQIMALGSVAEDVEMIMPIHNRPASIATSLSSSVATPALAAPIPSQLASGSDAGTNVPAGPALSWLAEPLSSPITGDFAAEFAEEVEAELDFVSSRPNSLDGKAAAGPEEDGSGEYLGGLGPDYLERYLVESRAGSEDGHGGALGVVDEARDVAGDEHTQELQVQYPGVEGHTEKDGDVHGAPDTNEDFFYLYRRPLGFDDIYSREDASTSASTSAFNSNSSGIPSGSMIFSSPPSFFTSPPSLSSSTSLSRSVSSTSYSSVDSAESADSIGVVESAEADSDERGGSGGSWHRNHRRFGGQNPSLSSLELDLESNNDMDGPSSERDRSVSHEFSSSTRSSSSHPSLSRTRSSSEDSSDLLHSPLQGDYSYFPYERAREVYQLQQQGLFGYHHPYSASALFGGLNGVGEREVLEDGERETERRVLSAAGMSFGQGSLSTSSRRHDHNVSEEFALSALSSEGLSFGFGYDNLGLPETATAEVGVEDEKMDMSLGHATTTMNMTTSTDRLDPSNSSFGNHERDHFTAPTSTTATTSEPFPAVDEQQHVDQNSEHLQPIGNSNSEISLSSPTPPSPVRPRSTNSVVQATSSPLPLPDHSSSEDMTSSSSPSSMLRTSPKTVVSPRMTSSDVDFALSSGSTSAISSLGGEMRDSSGRDSQRSRGNSAAMTSACRGGSSHGQTSNSNGSVYASAYSSSAVMRSNRGHRRSNDDDEDEEEERRRRRAFQKMQHVNDATIRLKPKPAPSSSSSENEGDGTDAYGEPSAPPTNSYLSVPRYAKSISRSPSSGESFVTASSSPSLQAMEFPSASSGSSQYASEDDRDDDEAHEDDEDEDDDVPLAQRIPGALTAQKSIRRQFREEREQRNREKAMRVERNPQAQRRARQITLRPAGAGSGSGMNVMGSSSSQDAALLAATAAATAAPQPQTRQRTLTLPGKPATTAHATFDPYDLTRKLQNVQLTEKPMSPLYQQQVVPVVPPQHLQQLGLHHNRSKSISRPSADQQRQQQITSPTTSSTPLPPSSASTPPPTLLRERSKTVRDPNSASHLRHLPSSAQPAAAASPPIPTPVKIPSLRPMRSFHRPDDRLPLSSDGDQRLGRSATTSRRTSNEQHGHGRQRSASRSRVSGERLEERPPPLPTSVNLNSRRSAEEQRKLVMSPTSPDMRLFSSRTSGELERSHRPSNASQLPQPTSKAAVSHQRVFVGNLQQFYMVEIGALTTAADVISVMDAQGALTGWAGSGGWMVFEVAQDFGMERPVRSYELLADIQSSWSKDKTVNFFVLKLTPLATPLSRSAIPSSSPTHSGYVEWEAKRGKWSKRWLQLREHSLWLSKRDNGKDEILLCSLSNFDVYNITRNHKSPKPFAFAIKSTDNLSFFEDTDDYLHTFSCSEKDGNVWLEKILIARSYVLHRERHILFSPKTSSENASTTLARSGTKKYTANSRPAHSHLPLPPLLAPKSLANNDVFEPGSLLAKQL